ncbi:hypothetical protein AB0A95_30225 [Micromonospora sp. NPDC049230]|uniref:hypothetical protein n=1 Tax=Micromonospora sp. NPDC049230 TaxID=3155502 RepID=UPI0033EDE06C
MTIFNSSALISSLAFFTDVQSSLSLVAPVAADDAGAAVGEAAAEVAAADVLADGVEPAFFAGSASPQAVSAVVAARINSTEAIRE